MSDNEVKKEKVVTRYDRKMQRRKEEKEREERRRKINAVVGVIVIVALIAFAASFPVRSYIATHETYVTINGENITREEFDYNYNNVVSQNSTYLSYFGVDATQDLSAQMYTDNLSWKDYFEELAVNSLKQSKGLKAEADAAGYEFDTSKEVEDFRSTLKEAADTAKVSPRKYVKQVYGPYATIKHISDYVAESARVNAYYEEISKDMKASDEEIQSYYQENKDDYDSVDYYVAIFPAETTSEAPTDEETAAAMEEAHTLALTAEENLTEEGDLQTNIKKSDAESEISDWLFDETRKKGDTTVIEDDNNKMYYALNFVSRYLDEVPTADIRVVMTQEMDGQTILDEWNAGEATEDSFAELCNKYSADNGSVAEGGLMEGVTEDSISSDIAEWVFDGNRAAGDTGFVATEEGYTYVMYYVGQGRPGWKNDIAGTLLSEAQQEYLNALTENITVEDKKGRLNYLKVRAEEEAAESEGAGDGENEEGVEDGENEEDVEDGENMEGGVSGNEVEAQ